jgi:hypothetical protein
MNYPRMGISMISMLGISIYIPTERLVLSPLLINQTRIEATSFRASRESGECHQHVSWSPNGRHREQSLNINESTGEMENFEDFGWFWSVQHWSLWFNLQSGFLIFFGRVLKSFNWLRGREGGDVVQSISKSCGMLSWLWQEGLFGWVNPFWQLFVLCHSVLSSIL